MTPAERLGSYMDALRPIIYIEKSDFAFVDELISEACADAPEVDICEYNHASGLVHFKTKMPLHESATGNQASPVQKLAAALSVYVTDEIDDSVLVLKDVHEELRDPVILAELKTIALQTMGNEQYKVSVIIVSSRLVIPAELEKFITVFDIPLPDQTEIKATLNDYAEYHKFAIPAEDLDELSLAFKGLGKFEIVQILNLAYQNTGRITKDNKDLILKEKQNAIRKTGLLEAVTVSKDISDVGGLENLVSYLKQKAHIYTNLSEAVKFGIDIPKGILIVGMPGCGKSLVAKVAAGLFQAPLFRFDVGKMLGKYVGESEANMRQALHIAEASTPCVLWIDEIEKAFAGIGSNAGGGEVTTRLFGYFLTWMQEKDNSVYVVATANDISSIPPEFLRKGRFDEMFYVELPDLEERKRIFEIHLSKRKPNWKSLDIDLWELAELATSNEEDLKRHLIGLGLDEESVDKAFFDEDDKKKSKEKEHRIDTFSGADIEAVIKTAIETAFDRGREITQEDLTEAIKNTTPIAQTLALKILELRKKLKAFQFKKASKSDHTNTQDSKSENDDNSSDEEDAKNNTHRDNRSDNEYGDSLEDREFFPT